jgi:hypothetical protein
MDRTVELLRLNRSPRSLLSLKDREGKRSNTNPMMFSFLFGIFRQDRNRNLEFAKKNFLLLHAKNKYKGRL